MSCCSKKALNFINQGVNKAVGNKEAMLARLSQIQFLAIDARVDWIECLQVCETQNFYSMYQTNENYEIPFGSAPMATFQEKSDCCCRLCVRHTREFKGEFRMDGFSVATVETKYNCHSWNPCCSCPCTFPQLYVMQEGQLAGIIRIPYYVCGCGKKGHPCSIMEMDILDKNYNLIYRLSGNCCQTSVCCLPFMCCGCETIRYDIREPATIGKPTGPGQQNSDLAVGTIKNVCRDCPEECFTKADRFGIQFPANADVTKRLLLIMAAIFLDYSQYEAFP